MAFYIGVDLLMVGLLNSCLRKSTCLNADSENEVKWQDEHEVCVLVSLYPSPTPQLLFLLSSDLDD